MYDVERGDGRVELPQLLAEAGADRVEGTAVEVGGNALAVAILLDVEGKRMRVRMARGEPWQADRFYAFHLVHGVDAVAFVARCACVQAAEAEFDVPDFVLRVRLRSAPRIPIVTPDAWLVTLARVGEAPRPARLVDISVLGICMDPGTGSDLVPGDHVDVVLKRGGTTLAQPAIVRNTRGGNAGCTFPRAQEHKVGVVLRGLYREAEVEFLRWRADAATGPAAHAGRGRAR